MKVFILKRPINFFDISNIFTLALHMYKWSNRKPIVLNYKCFLFSPSNRMKHLKKNICKTFLKTSLNHLTRFVFILIEKQTSLTDRQTIIIKLNLFKKIEKKYMQNLN